MVGPCTHVRPSLPPFLSSHERHEYQFHAWMFAKKEDKASKEHR